MKAEIRVQLEDFDPGMEIARLTHGRGDVGGVVSFIGLVRDVPMTLEHYPAMTLREIESVAAEADRRWPLLGAVIVHRHGRLAPGDRIVFVATASAHRKAAFEAAEFLIDWLKTRAPFWKQEEHADGPRWVEAKASDDDAAGRWEVKR